MPANCITRINCSYLQRTLFYYDGDGEVVGEDKLKSLLDIMQKDYTHGFKGLRRNESPNSLSNNILTPSIILNTSVYCSVILVLMHNNDPIA